MEKKIRYGIIGSGGIAGSHVNRLLKMPDVEIVAMTDLVPGRAEALAEKHGVEGCRFYPSHKELIDSEELDAVSICTYNATHAECAICALEKDISVMLEKPMSVTVEEAVEIIRADRKSKGILSIGFQPRYEPNVKMIKQIIESGELGKIYYIQTGGGRRRGIPGGTFIEKSTAGIGVMGDLGCYSLDMVLNAIGNPRPLTVSGHTSNYFGKSPKYNGADASRFDVEDFAAGFIRMENDIIVDFRMSWAMHADSMGETIFLGTEGALKVPVSGGWGEKVFSPMIVYKDSAGSQIQYETPLLPGVPEGVFYHKLRVFVDAVKTGGPPPVPSEQILYNQAIIDGIVKSAELGREVEIEIPEI